MAVCVAVSAGLAALAAHGVLLSVDAPLRWSALIVILVLMPLGCTVCGTIACVHALRVREPSIKWLMTLTGTVTSVLLMFCGMLMVYVAYVLSRI